MNKLKQNLIAVRDLLKFPRNWGQGFLAQNEHGTTRYPGQDDATCFCILGAVSHVTVQADSYCKIAATPEAKAIAKALDKHYSSTADTIIDFNDVEIGKSYTSHRRMHRKVLNALDKAIAAA